jgi:ribosome-associated toxin RatA of RatAB toxin-antitoxin module
VTKLTKRVSINASQQEVWDVLANFGGVEKWAPTVVESHCSTEFNRGLGAKRILTTTRGDVTEEVIVEWSEGHSFTFEIPGGLASTVKTLRETWSVEQPPNEAVVVVKVDYQLKNDILNSIFDSLFVRRELERMLIQNLAGLKYHIETGGTVTRQTAGLPVAAVV